MSRTEYYRYCPHDGEPLQPGDGPGRPQPRCRRCGFVDYQNPRPCVAVLILNNGRLLLARRGVEPAKGAWDIPGGFIDASESAEEAVVREALEETALHVRVREYLGSVPDVYGDRGVPTLNLCYLAEVVSGELRAQSDVAALEWVALDRLPDRMAFAHQDQLLRWAVQRAGRS
jgi:ADP-ribose pyrophosphatase YjhB (NUDIX family)